MHFRESYLIVVINLRFTAVSSNLESYYKMHDLKTLLFYTCLFPLNVISFQFSFFEIQVCCVYKRKTVDITTHYVVTPRTKPIDNAVDF